MTQENRRMGHPPVQKHWCSSVLSRKLISIYFVSLALLSFAIAATAPISQNRNTRLIQRPKDAITVLDVFDSARNGRLREAGVVVLFLVGPTADMVSHSVAVSAAVAVFLFFTGIAVSKGLKAGAAAGSIWTLIVVVALGTIATRISSSYTLGARALMFIPPLAVSVAVAVILVPQLIQEAVGQKDQV